MYLYILEQENNVLPMKLRVSSNFYLVESFFCDPILRLLI